VADADAVARALWAHLEQRSPGRSGDGDTVDHLLTQVEAGLRRWIGAEGYAALLSRAVAQTVPSHPALANITDLGIDLPANGVAPEVSSSATQDAVIALLVTMMQQLGLIIGEEMAIRLMELSGKPSTRGVAGDETNDSKP